MDRESAHELLAKKTEEKTSALPEKQAAAEKKTRSSGYQRQGIGEALVKSAVRTMGSTLGRQIIRGILGSLSKK